MLCDRCKQKPATTYYKQILNGQLKEYHLCEDCAAAAHLGLGLYSALHSDFDMLSSFLEEGLGRSATQHLQQKKCPMCGMTFEDIVNSGKVGCATCYETFYNQLLPSIQKIHGQTQHVGKVPASAGEYLRRSREMKKLEEELSRAIQSQEFERAATLRDRIKALKGEGKEDEQ